ncbi:FAD-dependent oxidoreductase [Amycolatopsis sp. NPDC051903]|uniref:FAD-dependent oxidoreductase n=1 Tax=Amycolatopsis sp. NPDC051903 TaxID=3363936 RepID=UPI003792974C
MSTDSAITYDLVVVGGGGAGLAAATQAAEMGASVALLEKNPELGGTTSRSIGSFSANGTRLQRKAGVADAPSEHFEDMAKFAGPLVERDNLALRRVYVDNSADTLHWVQDHGVALFGPMPEPPHRSPRMHNVLPNSSAYIYWFERAARKAGARILTNTAARHLVVEEGRVVGVETETTNGTRRVIRARRGVVLAAGDFSSSVEIKTSQFATARAARVEGINPTSTGDGLRLGMEVGGRILNGDLAVGPEMRFVTPSRKLLLQKLPPWRILTTIMLLALRWLPDAIQRPFIMSFATSYLAPSPNVFKQGAILVNADGERFTDESANPQLELPDQPGGKGYLVMDEATATQFKKWPNFISTAPGVAYAYIDDYRRNRRDIFHSARAVADLAAKIGADPRKLAASIGQSAGSEQNFVALGPLKSWIVLTEGGLAIDADMRVLDQQDDPIPGLFAAGSNGQGGLLLEGHGNHVGWAFISGRIAAKRALWSPTKEGK